MTNREWSNKDKKHITDCMFGSLAVLAKNQTAPDLRAVVSGRLRERG